MEGLGLRPGLEHLGQEQGHQGEHPLLGNWAGQRGGGHLSVLVAMSRVKEPSVSGRYVEGITR